MTGVGTRLAAVDSTTVCDGPQEHPVRIITDGQVCYAYGLGSDATDCGQGSRTQTAVEVICRQPIRGDDLCQGHVSADLATTTWTSDTESLALLEQYGEVVDR